jgi:hypothetical protein
LRKGKKEKDFPSDERMICPLLKMEPLIVSGAVVALFGQSNVRVAVGSITTSPLAVKLMAGPPFSGPPVFIVVHSVATIHQREQIPMSNVT